jgi:hypothetical protein
MRIRAALIFAPLLIAASTCFGQEHSLIPSDAAHLSPEERQNFLESICPGHTNADGCAVCPRETAWGSELREAWTLAAVTLGHFLAPFSDDALVTGYGCEPHASLYGGSFLFTRQGSGWRKVWYIPREAADQCKKLAGSDGRDRLVCSGGDSHQGFEDDFVFLLDPGVGPKYSDYEPLGLFLDVQDSASNCAAFNDSSVRSGRIDQVEFQQIAPDYNVRIVITARLGKAVVPRAVLAKCWGADHPNVTIATVQERYSFVFDGDKIVPDPRNPPMEDGTAIAPVTSYSVEHQ